MGIKRPVPSLKASVFFAIWPKEIFLSQCKIPWKIGISVIRLLAHISTAAVPCAKFCIDHLLEFGWEWNKFSRKLKRDGEILHKMDPCTQSVNSCVGKLTSIGSDNGLSPVRRQAIIWTNARVLLIGPVWANFNEILVGVQIFPFRKMHLHMSSANLRPVCLGLNVLTHCGLVTLDGGRYLGQHWLM